MTEDFADVLMPTSGLLADALRQMTERNAVLERENADPRKRVAQHAGVNLLQAKRLQGVQDASAGHREIGIAKLRLEAYQIARNWQYEPKDTSVSRVMRDADWLLSWMLSPVVPGPATEEHMWYAAYRRQVEVTHPRDGVTPGTVDEWFATAGWEGQSATEGA